MMVTPLAALILALLLGPGDAPGSLEGYTREKSEFGVVYHRGWSAGNRESLVDLVEDTVRTVQKRLGRELERDITVVLVPNRAELQRLARAHSGREFPDWVLGLAFPGSAWILARADGPPIDYLWRSPSRLTLTHEISHLVIHRRSDTVIPRWFDEGLSMYLAGQDPPPDDQAVLSGLARVGGLFSVRQLELEFPDHHQASSLAYQQSFLLVSYLQERFGPDTARLVLDGLESGQRFVDIYEGLSGEKWATFEVGFARWVVARRSLWEVFGAVFNVWTVITLLALAAIVRSAVRTRRLRRKLADEELAEAGDEADRSDALAEDSSASGSDGDRS